MHSNAFALYFKASKVERGCVYLLHHVESTTAAVEFWEDIVVLEKSRKHILWVQRQCPHVLHTALQQKLVLSFTEVLSLSHPGRPELEEGAALDGEVHVEGEVGDDHGSELLHPREHLFESVKK